MLALSNLLGSRIPLSNDTVLKLISVEYLSNDTVLKLKRNIYVRVESMTELSKSYKSCTLQEPIE